VTELLTAEAYHHAGTTNLPFSFSLIIFYFTLLTLDFVYAVNPKLVVVFVLLVLKL
jgi:hypothetical protein